MKTLREMMDIIESAQTVAEDVSGLTDAEYNTVARYAKSKYPAMVIAALGRNPDGSVNVRMHDTKGLGITKEFKVRFAEPEETDIDEQGVAEDQATARMGLMSAMGSNDNNPADQRRVMAQRSVEQLASKK